MPTVIIVKTDNDSEISSIVKSILADGENTVAPKKSEPVLEIKKIEKHENTENFLEQKTVSTPAAERKRVEQKTNEIYDAIQEKRIERANNINLPLSERYQISPEHPCFMTKAENNFYYTQKREPVLRMTAFMQDDNPLFRYINKNFVLTGSKKKQYIKYMLGEIDFLLKRNFYVSRSFFCKRYNLSELSFISVVNRKTYKEIEPADITKRTLEDAFKFSEEKSVCALQNPFAKKLTTEDRYRIINLMGRGASAHDAAKAVGTRGFIAQNVYRKELLNAGLSQADKKTIMQWASKFSFQKNSV